MDNSDKKWLPHYWRGGSKDQHKESKLSKDSIGQPMKLEKNGRFSSIFEPADVPGSSSVNSPSMVMKCIIVHPDEMGYGLTVSGDNPVFIQSAKEGGAAAKAGVVEGDRILKVNGDGVKNLNHTEVVKLIKEKSYVVLTLLGDPVKGGESSSEFTGTSQVPQSGDVATSQQMAKHPNIFHDEKVDTIKKMLEQEKAEVERIKEEYAKNPDQKILKDLGAAEKLKQDLEKQLWKAESLKERNLEQASVAMTSSTSDLDVGGSSDTLAGDTSSNQAAEDSTGDASAEKIPSQAAARLKRAPVPVDTGDQQDAVMVATNEQTSNTMNNAVPLNPYADATFNKWNIQPSQQNVDILNFEDDDDILAECDSNHGPFGNFDTLRQRPAYLAVFLNYIIESRDPSNFLLFMVVDSYKGLASSKEMVRHGDVIYKSYLSPDAALKVSVDDGISRSIHAVLTSKSPAEETLRGVFDPAVQVALKEIRIQLSTFRKKREQGVGNMYGDDILHQALKVDVQSDNKLVDEIVAPTLAKLQQTTSVDDFDQARTNIKIDAIQTFLTQYGTKRTKKTSRIYSKLRPKPNSMMKTHRISGSMDSIIDEKDKRLSGIGQIFGGKRVEKTKSKLEKPKSHERGNSKKDKGSRASRRHTIRDPPPVFSAGFLKPSSKVSSSMSADQLSFVATSSGSCGNSIHDPHAQRPKSVPFDGSLRTIETHSVTIHPAPQFHEAPPNFSTLPIPGVHGEEKYDTSESDFLTTSTLTRAGSFRRYGDQPKHGTSKSNSDPDKNKVEQAVVQHNASHPDQSDSVSLLSSSSHSILPDEKRFMVPLPSITDSEIDFDVSEQPQWSDSVPKSVAKGLEKKEVKRQQVIDELISTEQHHVRNLKILEKFFFEPLLKHGLLTRDEHNQAFPNLKEILQLHREFNRWLQELKEADGHVVKNIGDVLLARFDGEGGNMFKNECATYCGNQFTVLSLIKEKSKKDQKFHHFLEEVQRHPVSRKLHLKDFVPMEFQRLTKYPLLLDNIIKHTKKKQDAEIKKVKTACERCREILTFVNQTVKEAEDKQKIIEIQKNLDREPILKMKNGSDTLNEFKSMDLTERTIIHQGALTWRVTQVDKRKLISIHCILYDNVLVLLQKQGDRYILRCQEGQVNQASETAGNVHDPFISMQRAHVSTVATDKRAFFVVSYVSAQMYEFVATSTSQMKEWMSIIAKTAKSEIPPSTQTRRRPALSIPVPTQVLNDDDEDEKSNKVIDAGELVGHAEDNHPDIQYLHHDSEEQEDLDTSSFSPSSRFPDTPSRIRDRILSKQQEIECALAAKHRLLAEISSLEDTDLEEMLDMCAADAEPDPLILVRHAVLCADRLVGIINTSTTADKTFVKRRNEEDLKRLSVNENLFPNEHSNVHVAEKPEKWASRLSPPSTILIPEKSLLSERVSSGTLNSISDLPLSESDPILSPNTDTSSDVKPSPFGAFESPIPDLDSSTDPPLSPTPVQITTSNPIHRVSEFLPPLAHQSRTGSNPSSSDPSRPSSGVDLWVLSEDVPVDKMMETVLLLQTQLTRLMHVTEEHEKERNILLAENQRLKKELEMPDNESSKDGSSPPPYSEFVQE